MAFPRVRNTSGHYQPFDYHVIVPIFLGPQAKLIGGDKDFSFVAFGLSNIA